MDAQTWNERYAASDELVWTAEPNRFLVEEAAGLSPARALDLACGEGRNAVWLAGLGWQVTGVDFSSAGLDKARRLAERQGATVRWVESDVTSWRPDERFDLVLLFYLQVPAAQRRRALGVAVEALAQGGLLVVVAHDSRNLHEGVGGPQDPSVLYTADDVVSDLDTVGADLEVERSEAVLRPVGDAQAIDCLVRARRR